jgi:hypothetical protein
MVEKSRLAAVREAEVDLFKLKPDQEGENERKT